MRAASSTYSSVIDCVIFSGFGLKLAWRKAERVKISQWINALDERRANLWRFSRVGKSVHVRGAGKRNYLSNFVYDRSRGGNILYESGSKILRRVAVSQALDYAFGGG